MERPSIILDRNLEEFGRIFVQNRSEVPLEQVPQKLIDALVAGEDSRFFTHDGVDYIGIMRAAQGNLKSGNADSGASTLTMQLARNAFPLQKDAEERGGDKYDRKFVEIFLAHRIEERFSKDQIMEFYLNRIAFGSGFFGIRSASLGYFGKEPRDLEVWECASLVGCIKNPSMFSPLRSKEKNKVSRDNVLKRMEIEGFITTPERDQYQAKPVVVNPKPLKRNTSYFNELVKSLVNEKVDPKLVEAGGLKIFTTIDKGLQKTFEKRLKDQLYLVEEHAAFLHPLYEEFDPTEGGKPEYLQGAGLCFNHQNGEVLAYVGGRDFSHNQYDFVQLGMLPLGTAFLPTVYAAAIENGIGLSRPVIDEAMDNRMVMVEGEEGILAEWGEEVNEPYYQGMIPAREGLAKSKIAASVRLGREIGLEKVNAVAKRFGFSMPTEDPGDRLLARGLIGSESASITGVAKTYGAIGNGGERIKDLVLVQRIENRYGEVIYEPNETAEFEQMMEETDAFLLHNALQDVSRKGNLAQAFDLAGEFPFEGAVKTGTNSTFSDHWCVGYNGPLSCAIWSGFLDGREAIYSGAFAKDSVYPVWHEVMRQAATIEKPVKVKKPDDIIAVEVCSHSGLLLTHECHVSKRDGVSGKTTFESTGVIEWFKKGEQPTSYCNVHGDFNELAGSMLGGEAQDLLYALPVKPAVDILLGDDPYGAVIPKYDPFGEDKPKVVKERDWSSVLDTIDVLDTEATIYHPRPGRLFIDE